VTFTARITDALSGVSYWCVELFSQSGQQAQGQCFFEGPVSGDANNGTFQGTLTLPQYAEQGQWRVFRVTLFDRAGNWLALSGNELEMAGFPTALTVNSMQDTAAPTLEGFDFSPDMVDTSSSPASVTFTARITDALSGVSYWCVELFSQSGQQAQGQCFFEGPVSGDLNNGTFQGTLTLPQYAEQGQWRVFRVTLFDRVGNWLALSADQLAALSFPTELLNGPQIIPVQIDIKPGSSTNSINLGSQGTVPVAILSTPTFDARTVDPLSITLASATVAVKGKGTPMASFQDVNQDGLLDLVVHVETQALQLTVGDTVAILEGQTFDGRRIRGSDTVRVVP
jgi:hypothetical protein